MIGRARTFAQIVFIAAVVAWVAIGPHYYKQTVDGSYHHAQQEVQNVGETERADDRIAKYTKWLAFFTGALVIVSAIQIGFLIRAEKITRISADAGRKSADAASQANRPWVHIKSAQFIEPLKIGTTGAGTTISTVIENIGRSPALGVTEWIQFIPMTRGMNFDVSAEKFISEAFKHADLYGMAVFPGKPIEGGLATSILREEWEAASFGSERRAHFLLGVCVCYRLHRGGELKYSSRIFPIMAMRMDGAEVEMNFLNATMDKSMWDDAT